MKIIKDKNKLIKIIKNEKNLGFVPTMGAIHKGHLSLVNKSNKLCNTTIVSIFINRPQFSKKSDYKKYPKLLKNDINLLKKSKVDILYLPKEEQIYPQRPNKNIKIHPFSKQLCGKFRTGHFESVVDVVDRFLKIIQPKKTFFGEKDMQQLKLIKNFVNKHYKKINVVGCKTIREINGIAYSSRNLLLSNNQKKIASSIYKYILNNKSKLINGKIKIVDIKNKILSLGVRKIDYVELHDINKIIKPYMQKNNYKIFISYYLGAVRLIDNI